MKVNKSHFGQVTEILSEFSFPSLQDGYSKIILGLFHRSTVKIGNKNKEASVKNTWQTE